MSGSFRPYENWKSANKEKRSNRIKKNNPFSAESEYSFGDFLSDVGNKGIGRLFEAGSVQAKLTLSGPQDASELEADRIANEVVSGNSPIAVQPSETPSFSAKGVESALNVPHSTEKKIDFLAGKGAPLGKRLRDYFEPRFSTTSSGISPDRKRPSISLRKMGV